MKIVNISNLRYNDSRNHFLVYLGICFFIVFMGCITGCTSSFLKTKPNKPYEEIFSQNFERIKAHNEILYYELRKLPELQDGIISEEARALYIMTNTYFQNRDKFDTMFNQMHNIGNSEVRKYNSLLQALYWLFEDRKSDEAKEVINDFDLEELLDRAWWNSEYNYKQKGKWLQGEAQKLYDSCMDEGIKKKIQTFCKENPNICQGIAVQYTFKMLKENPEKFGYDYDENKFDLTQAKNKLRWEDWKTVRDRLSSPETIEYWTRKNLLYDPYPYSRRSNLNVFENKLAHCLDTSEFIKYLLNRAGYKSGIVKVEFEKLGGLIIESHFIAYYKDKGAYFIIDNGTDWSPGIIYGPFNHLEDIHYKILSYNP